MSAIPVVIVTDKTSCSLVAIQAVFQLPQYPWLQARLNAEITAS